MLFIMTISNNGVQTARLRGGILGLTLGVNG